jgi:hypothetical protein
LNLKCDILVSSNFAFPNLKKIFFFKLCFLKCNVYRYAAAQGPPAPVLIVCPTSVLTNWERELKQW